MAQFLPGLLPDLLPDLPLIEIFKHLGLVDLARARAVRRRWRALIDGFVRIKKLVIHSHETSMPGKWFHLNKPIRLDDMFRLNVIGSGFSKFNQTIVRLHLLARLEKLKIVKSDTRIFDGYLLERLLKRLVKFTALVHLEIEMFFGCCGGLSCSLFHPNLRVLSLKRFLSVPSHLNIKIDCPRLEVLECNAPFPVTHPETIKQLYYYEFASPSYIPSPSDLEAFANVERYVCFSLSELEQVNIWSLPKLKELRVEIHEYDYDDDEHVQVRTVLADVIAQKKRLGSARGRPKVYLDNKECSANLRETHPYLFPGEYWTDEDSTDDEDATDEDSTDDEDATDEETTDEEMTDGETADEETADEETADEEETEEEDSMETESSAEESAIDDESVMEAE